MWRTINYLNEPSLVAEIQRYFDVQIFRNIEEENCVETSDGIISDKYDAGVKNRSEHAANNKAVNGSAHVQNGICNRTEKTANSFHLKHTIITNKYWHFLFTVGTALGDEIFYALIFPYWFWNVDGSVGRRVVLVWMVVMYIGQCIKDVVRWPRPSYPPVIRLQKKWAEEYGLPSTHAMVGLSIPFSVILYTKDRYEYSILVAVLIAVTCCSLICVSRVYLGMHTVLDIIAGLLLTVILMIPLVPLVDMLDYFILRNLLSPIFTLGVGISLIAFYPVGDHWTPTRGDTTMIVGVCVGLHVASWINYQLGLILESSDVPPFPIGWPSYSSLLPGILRTVIGFFAMFATRTICKSVSYPFLCKLLHLNSSELKAAAPNIKNQYKIFVELTCTFLTYFFMGFNIVFPLPILFKFLGIERLSYYVET